MCRCGQEGGPVQVEAGLVSGSPQQCPKWGILTTPHNNHQMAHPADCPSLPQIRKAQRAQLALSSLSLHPHSTESPRGRRWDPWWNGVQRMEAEGLLLPRSLPLKGRGQVLRSHGSLTPTLPHCTPAPLPTLIRTPNAASGPPLPGVLYQEFFDSVTAAKIRSHQLGSLLARVWDLGSSGTHHSAH